MKQIKQIKRKILSIALAAMLIFALMLPFMTMNVFAAYDPDKGSITIKAPQSISILGATFKAYRIFDFTHVLTPEEAYLYTLNTEFSGFEAYVADIVSGTAPDDWNGFDLNNGEMTLKEYLYNSDNAPTAPAIPTNLTADQAQGLTAALKAYIEFTLADTGDPHYFDDVMESATATAADKVVIDNGGTTGIPLGYYIVFSDNLLTTEDDEGNPVDVNSLCILTTTDPNSTINLKTDVPTVESKKAKVKGSTDPNWDNNESNGTTANIGDVIEFKITTRVPDASGYDEYIFNVIDKMTKGLTFDETLVTANLVVTVTDVEGTGHGTVHTLTNPAYYTTTFDTIDDDAYGAAYEDGHILTIIFETTKFIEFTPGSTITITYEATLNDAARVSSDSTSNGESNKAGLEYSNDRDNFTHTGKTPDEEVKISTFDIDIFKYAGAILTPTALSGAEFLLYKDNGNPFTWNSTTNAPTGDYVAALPIKFKANTSPTPHPRTITGAQVYIHDKSGGLGTGATNALVSPTNGHIQLIGLEEGTYYLVETKAPTNYNKLEKPIKIFIKSDTNTTTGVVTYKFTIDNGTPGDENDSEVPVLNNSGAKFPETGGIGRIIFYLTGSLLVIGAGLFLIVHVKMSSRRKRQMEIKNQLDAIRNSYN